MDGSLLQFGSFNQSYVKRCVVVVAIILLAAPVSAQRIRTKKPDRGVYQPPLTEVVVQDRQAPLGLKAAPKSSRSRGGPLVGTALLDASNPGKVLSSAPPSMRGQAVPSNGQQDSQRQQDSQPRHLRPVGFEDAIPMPPLLNASGQVISTQGIGGHVINDHVPNGNIISDRVINESIVPDSGAFIDAAPIHGSPIHGSPVQGDFVGGGGDACGCSACGPVGNGCDAAGCDSLGCDSFGCDSLGCSSATGLALLRPNSRISLDPKNWFGSIELLLMFRRGDRPPALVTTGPAIDSDTAGELGQAGTQVLVGGESIFKDRTAGGRLQLGTWLDARQSRSLMLRGWFAGEESFGFTRNQDSLAVIARPFLNVSGNQPEEQDTQVVAFPDRATGSLTVQGESDVFGADVSVRQFWYGSSGVEIDFLYGYQYMRLDENLSISTSSVSLDDDFAPLGSTLAIRDQFDTENEFHGAQLGFSTRARHACWSFRSLTKLGFGSVARTADLQGTTTTGIDGTVATVDEGLLVRNTNSGKRTDHTFGWVPELDFTVGYHRFPQWEVTFGYHIIALTDALQVSGAIDPNLATNLSVPLVGREAPQSALRFDTFYVQGLHFGLEYVY